MKRTFFSIIILLLTVYSFGQGGKNEYRYFSVKLGLVNSIVPLPEGNPYLLARTPFGDMAMQAVRTVNYTPGGAFGILYHIDAKSDMFGIVFGVQVQNYGYSVKYMTVDSNFFTQDQYRFTSVVIPFYIKYNPKNIFVNQVYMTVGLKQYVNILAQNYQTSTWNQAYNIRTLPGPEYHRVSTVAFLGLNYNVFYLDIDYVFNGVINKNYKTLTAEGVVSPYENVDYRMKFYITTGIHLPLNRWLTARNWTAEKIRRLLNPVR